MIIMGELILTEDGTLLGYRERPWIEREVEKIVAEVQFRREMRHYAD